MIYSLEGPMGNGKSTTLAMMAYWWYVNEGRKIISNVPLAIPYTPFSLQHLKEHFYDSEYDNSVVIWDEGNQVADAHAESSIANQIIATFAGSTRKRNAELLIGIHKLKNLGLRTREHVLMSGLRGYSKCVKEKPCLKCHGTGIYKGETCDRCLGYTDRDTPRDKRTFVAYILPTFYNRQRNWFTFWLGKGDENCIESNIKRLPLEYIGNYYFHLFPTEAKVAMRKSKLERMETAEVGAI